MTPEVKLFLDVERAITRILSKTDDEGAGLRLKREGELWVALYEFKEVSLSELGSTEDEAVLSLLERSHEAAMLGDNFNLYNNLAEKGKVYVYGNASSWRGYFIPFGSPLVGASKAELEATSANVRRVSGKTEDACVLRLWLDLFFSYN